MKLTGVNMTNVKNINRASVIRLLLSRGAMSRTDLANELNLTTATLTSICSDFIHRGLVVQSEKAGPKNPGRQKFPLEIVPTYKYVIAINLHYTGHVIAITDLFGNSVAIDSFNMASPYTAANFCKELSNACIRLLWENSIPSDSVLGACACIIGAVNQNDGICLHPFNIFEENHVPLYELLKKELHFPVCIESNVCAFLNAEILFGDISTSNVLAIKWGPGVGSASSINGVICKDSQYHSAEVGHTYFYQNSNTICKCGLTGCLETGINLLQIAEQIQDFAQDSPVLQKIIDRFGSPNIKNINKFILADCPPLQEFLDSCTRDLAISVNNAIQVFSPDRVVLFGTLFETDYMTEGFLKHIQLVNPSNSPELFQKSSFDSVKEYIGPAATAIIRFLIETGGELTTKF